MKLNHFFAALLLVSASCTNNSFTGPDIPGVELTVQATIDTEQASNKQNWVTGDKIGVSVVGMEGYAASTNIAFAYDEGNTRFQASEKRIYLKGAKQQLSAYYPYSPTDNTYPIGMFVHAGEEMQEESRWSELDYLYATAEATRDVPLASFCFRHLMGQLALHFEIEGEQMGAIEYTISGIIAEGEVNVRLGEITPIRDTSPVQMALSTTTTEDVLIIIPQQANLNLELLYNGKIYQGSIPEAQFEAGVCSNYKVKIDESSVTIPQLIITHEGISNWRPGKGGSISSEEEGDDPDQGGDDPDQGGDDPTTDSEAETEVDSDSWKPGKGGSITSEEEIPNQEGDDPEVNPESGQDIHPEDWTPGEGGSVESEEE